jgi:hypothetical protein
MLETKIRRVMVPGQPGGGEERKNTFLIPHLNRKKLGVMAHACHRSYGKKCKTVQAGLSKKVRP